MTVYQNENGKIKYLYNRMTQKLKGLPHKDLSLDPQYKPKKPGTGADKRQVYPWSSLASQSSQNSEL